MKTLNTRNQFGIAVLVSAFGLTGCFFGIGEKDLQDARGLQQEEAPAIEEHVSTNADGIALPSIGTLGVGTVGIRHFAQIRLSMATVTGVDPNDGEVNTFFNAARTRLSIDGNAQAVSPAALLSSSGMAAIFCKKLIANDAGLTVGTRRAHNDVNFAANNTVALTTDVRNKVIQKYAELFWRRAATASEATTVSNAISEALLNRTASTTETRNGLQVGCTAMLSSLEFVKI